MGLIDFIKDLNVSECTKRGIAGVMLGSTTGIAVGFVNLATSSGLATTSTSEFKKALKKLSERETQLFYAKQHIQIVGLLGMWSGVYQGIRCQLGQMKDEQLKDPIINAGLSGIISLAPFIPIKAFRRFLVPWSLIMVGLDIYHGGLRQEKPR